MELPTQESGPASPLAETVLRGPPPLSGPMTGRNPATGNGKEHHSLETAAAAASASWAVGIGELVSPQKVHLTRQFSSRA